ncbi:MAG TPA: squalene/phytoene synthase family protein [Verrucomicrobiae bacterium]|nr:squalene/phytoene synthase family protein [Verrucomicrobiae bacterium]
MITRIRQAISGVAPPETDREAAERFNREMARREAKNFYWGFISLPHEQRMAIYALYNYGRILDDEADDSALPDLPGRLKPYRERVARAVRGEYADDDPIMRILAEATARYQIPERELAMLVDGVEMDNDRKRYADWEDLRGYCYLVASVVGRMCVRIFGFTDPVALERADDLGLALQLTNILRDVTEDVRLGRIYLPQDELALFGIDENALIAGDPGPSWEAFVGHQAERARALYASGYEVLKYIPRRPAACVRTMAGIYEGILSKIARDPWLPLHERAALAPTEKLRVMVKSWLSSA